MYIYCESPWLPQYGWPCGPPDDRLSMMGVTVKANLFIVLKVYYIFSYFVKSYTPGFSKKNIKSLKFCQNTLHLVLFVCYKWYWNASLVQAERSQHELSGLCTHNTFQESFLYYKCTYLFLHILFHRFIVCGNPIKLTWKHTCHLYISHFNKCLL